MDPWPERWIVDDWADTQLSDFKRFHGNRGVLENIDGFCEWTGPFVEFQISRSVTARGPITVISLTPTPEASFEDDLDMSGFASILELISPPTRTAVESGFLINSTEGLFRVKAPHADEEGCEHQFCR